jgi:hypothetical protein
MSFKNFNVFCEPFFSKLITIFDMKRNCVDNKISTYHKLIRLKELIIVVDILVRLSFQKFAVRYTFFYKQKFLPEFLTVGSNIYMVSSFRKYVKMKHLSLSSGLFVLKVTTNLRFTWLSTHLKKSFLGAFGINL